MGATVQPARPHRRCDRCGGDFAAKCSHQRYCSRACARRKHRERPCLNSECERTSVNGRYCPRCAARLYRLGTLDEPTRSSPAPIVGSHGYVRQWVGVGHPMANATGYCYLHRLVMAEHIGRPLLPFENVHHKTGNKRDNRLDNLELWTRPPMAGQRVDDLVAFVVSHYRDRVELALVT